MDIDNWYNQDWDDVEAQPNNRTMEGPQTKIVFNNTNGTFSKIEIRPIAKNKYKGIEYNGDGVVDLLFSFVPELGNEAEKYINDVYANPKDYGWGEYDDVQYLPTIISFINQDNKFTITKAQLNSLFNKMEEDDCLDADFARMLMKHVK